MRLGEIKCPPGSKKNRKRLGQGPGTGTGKTAGKGHKGQRARSGARRGNRIGFTGGTSPLFRHLPKIGFSNIKFKTVYQIVNLQDLAASGLAGEVGPAELASAGLVRKTPNSRARAVMACSPPESSDMVCNFLPGGLAMISRPASRGSSASVRVRCALPPPNS